MPAIAGALILVGVGMIAGNLEEFRDVWDISLVKRVIMLTTLLATLVLPVQNGRAAGRVPFIHRFRLQRVAESAAADPAAVR